MQQTEQGSAMYRGMDAATLDRQYDARASVASFETEYDAYLRDSRIAQATIARNTFVYDEASGQRLDLYGAAEGRPVFLWIHGGYWHGSTREDNAFVASGLVPHGVAVATVGYTLAPAVNIGEIVRQVRSAVSWLVRHGAEQGLNVDRIHVGGSSAGGHLVGMLLSQGWAQQAEFPDDIIGAGLALSGLYDLEPLQHTVVNSWMHFTARDIELYSPERQLPMRSSARLIASVGGLETDEFRRQTAHYAQVWEQAGHAAEVVDMPHHNHFNLAGTLARPDSVLVEVLMRAITSCGR